MPIPKIVTQYEYEKFEKPGVDFPASDKNSKSKAIQSDMDAADINKIMARYEKTGVLIDASGVERQPVFGDFSALTDYHDMLTAVRTAERVFGTLPASTRNFFKNDPQALIDFLEDPKNDEKAAELGLKARVEKPIVKQPELTPAELAALAAKKPVAPAVPPATPTA